MSDSELTEQLEMDGLLIRVSPSPPQEAAADEESDVQMTARRIENGGRYLQREQIAIELRYLLDRLRAPAVAQEAAPSVHPLPHGHYTFGDEPGVSIEVASVHGGIRVTLVNEQDVPQTITLRPGQFHELVRNYLLDTGSTLVEYALRVQPSSQTEAP